jgi:DNA-binding transcriptional regulator LsrR (DeoR family)
MGNTNGRDDFKDIAVAGRKYKFEAILSQLRSGY